MMAKKPLKCCDALKVLLNPNEFLTIPKNEIE